MNKTLTYALKPVEWLLQWPDKDNVFLKGNYAPVDKEITQECEVVGVLPEAVYGEFARNGPNPRFSPKAGYHWFDGDGMVHGVRIKGGKALYANRFVRTKKLAADEEAGEALAMTFGDFASKLVIPKLLFQILKTKLGLVTDYQSMNESTANTSLEYHSGRLLALGEAGVPYALRVMCDGVMETIGSSDFQGELKTPFTAHPKIDPATGKLYGFGYNITKKPYVTFYVVGADGKVERQFPIDVPRATMMHDFAITEKHAVFLDLPMIFDAKNILKGKIPVVFDITQEARMGVLPLDATDSSAIQWFVLPESFMAFHVLNAWEEKVDAPGGGQHTVVKVVTCDFFDIDLAASGLMDKDKLALPSRMQQPHFNSLNLDTGESSRVSILPFPPKEGLDFPQLRRSLVGRKNRFGYCTGFNIEGFPTSCVKLDLQAESPETAQVGRIDFGESVGGECIFVPSKADFEGDEEDDGFLVTFCSPRDGGNSELRVWNAKTMSDKPVATIKLPARVPFGFHAIFVSEADLAKQQQQ